MNDFWISLSAYGGVTTQKALAVLWAAGVRQVELAIGVKPDPNTVEVLRDYQQAGMKYRAHHAFVWESFRSFNLAHNFDTCYFERLTTWLMTMDITAYSVHAGSYSVSNERDIAYIRFLDHVEKLDQLCRDRGIRLGVETMYPTPFENTKQYLLQDVFQVEQFLQDTSDIALVIDMSHLNIWKKQAITEKLDLLNLAKNRLLEIHISDNDGYQDSHTTVSEKTWWVPHVITFPDVPIVLESRMNHQSVESVQRHIEGTLSLLTVRPNH